MMACLSGSISGIESPPDVPREPIEATPVQPLHEPAPPLRDDRGRRRLERVRRCVEWPRDMAPTFAAASSSTFFFRADAPVLGVYPHRFRGASGAMRSPRWYPQLGPTHRLILGC